MARVHNSLTLSTALVSVFDATTDGGPICGFRVRCLAGAVRIWCNPLVPDTAASGVLLSAGGSNTDWSPLSDISGPFISVQAKGTASSTSISFRPEVGAI